MCFIQFSFGVDFFFFNFLFLNISGIFFGWNWIKEINLIWKIKLNWIAEVFPSQWKKKLSDVDAVNYAVTFWVEIHQKSNEFAFGTNLTHKKLQLPNFVIILIWKKNSLNFFCDSSNSTKSNILSISLRQIFHDLNNQLYTYHFEFEPNK